MSEKTQVADVHLIIGKETYELVEGIGEFVGAVKAALADGWQPGSDIPVIMMAAIEKLGPAVQGADQIDDELKGNVGHAVAAMGILGTKIAEIFFSKK